MKSRSSNVDDVMRQLNPEPSPMFEKKESVPVSANFVASAIFTGLCFIGLMWSWGYSAWTERKERIEKMQEIVGKSDMLHDSIERKLMTANDTIVYYSMDRARLIQAELENKQLIGKYQRTLDSLYNEILIVRYKW